jgi:hypothetical protein
VHVEESHVVLDDFVKQGFCRSLQDRAPVEEDMEVQRVIQQILSSIDAATGVDGSVP